MNINNMRAALKAKYPKGDWPDKVEAMPDEQVVAIYMRLKKDGLLDNNKRFNHAIIVPPKKMHLFCMDCHQVFTVDNPDTTECIYCGSTNLSHNLPTTRIEKETEHEDF